MHSQRALADFIVWAGGELLSNRIKGNAQKRCLGLEMLIFASSHLNYCEILLKISAPRV
jgi:hypothetical protein